MCLIPTQAFADPPRLKTFHVKVESVRGEQVFPIRAPTPSVALDSIFVAAIYNKSMGKIYRATVLETDLSTDDIPKSEFYVETDYKSYRLFLGIANPEFVLTAIQASKYLMSISATRNVTYRYNNKTLKAMEPVKFILKLKNKQMTYLLNTDQPELTRFALEGAVIISKYRNDFVSMSIPKLENKRTMICKNLFR